MEVETKTAGPAAATKANDVRRCTIDTERGDHVRVQRRRLATKDEPIRAINDYLPHAVSSSYDTRLGWDATTWATSLRHYKQPHNGRQFSIESRRQLPTTRYLPLFFLSSFDRPEKGLSLTLYKIL